MFLQSNEKEVGEEGQDKGAALGLGFQPFTGKWEYNGPWLLRPPKDASTVRSFAL